MDICGHMWMYMEAWHAIDVDSMWNRMPFAGDSPMPQDKLTGFVAKVLLGGP